MLGDPGLQPQMAPGLLGEGVHLSVRRGSAHAPGAGKLPSQNQDPNLLALPPDLAAACLAGFLGSLDLWPLNTAYVSMECLTQSLHLAGLLEQTTTDGVGGKAYKQQKIIDHNSEIGNPRARHPQIWCLVRTCVLVHGLHLFPVSLPARGVMEPPGPSFTRTLIPFRGPHPHDLITSQRSPSSPKYHHIGHSDFNL